MTETRQAAYYYERDPEVAYGAPPPRKSLATFVYQTLNYVLAQLCITTVITAAMYFNRQNVINYINGFPFVIWVPIIFTFITLFGMYCTKNPHVRQVMFWSFTVACSFMVGFSVLSYAPDVVVKAVATTAIIVAGVDLYAMRCAKQGKDLSFLGPGLFAALFCLIIIGILNIFIQSSALGLLLCVAGVLIFTGLLLYDLNRLYTGVEEGEVMDPMLAAVQIYLDVINLFLHLLELYDRCDGNSRS